jgi:enoyl-CoA hydratase/carnithine racemase
MPARLETRTHDQHTLVLTIHHPEMRNALDPAICVAGVEALNGAERSADVRAVVITGAGAHFCAGGNLQRMQERRQEDAETQAQGVEALHQWIETLSTYPKPVIAAVEGAAAGAGFSLALACDMVVAARDAAFVMAYAGVGLSPDGGATWSLARTLPRQLAAELLLCGERIGAERLHALGIVNRLARPGEALTCALALADTLAARAPNAVASTKELLSEAPANTLTQQLARERDQFVRNLQHPNAGEGIAAFLEKRPPRYR